MGKHYRCNDDEYGKHAATHAIGIVRLFWVTSANGKVRGNWFRFTVDGWRKAEWTRAVIQK
jgi:hypothetical protein